MPDHVRRGFKDRAEAGRRLAALLWKYSADENAVILALPRGGVPVAAEVSTALSKPIDVLVVRKLGVPGREEIAMGAITCGGVRILDEETIDRFGISCAEVDAVVARESAELKQRMHAYREDHPAPDVRGKRVILVDDGIATGATVSAAVQLLRRQGAGSVVVAVPVAAQESIARMREEADEVVVVNQPDDFGTVAAWYEEFPETTDQEVRTILTGNTPELVLRVDGGTQWIFNRSPIQMVRRLARPFVGEDSDYDGLIEAIGDATVAILGSASYGTADFDRIRTDLTRRLIEEKGFQAVVTEADAIDSWRVNRYVRGTSRDEDVADALGDLDRFPAWVWCNPDVAEFIDWLRQRNATTQSKVGLYGLDALGLRRSMHHALRELASEGPEAFELATSLFGCVERFGHDPQDHTGAGAVADLPEERRAELLARLVDHRIACPAPEPGAADDAVDAVMLAFLRDLPRERIEDSFRRSFSGHASSWNLRDEIMIDGLRALVSSLRSQTGDAKVVVWAHNAHVGDARATELSWRGEVSLGQLAREAFPGGTRLVGMTGYAGKVTASPGWGLAPERIDLPPTAEGSIEKLLHQVGLPEFWLDFTTDHPAVAALKRPRLQRAVGVIANAQETNGWPSFEACVAGQFDALIHCDSTSPTPPRAGKDDWHAPLAGGAAV